ncbi:MAG: phosphoribosylanthranilate isomerase [Planctomycetia bacterium]|nr:phosphoribosylanthranilate isomerase [Planctomycetia bacterium]
MTKVKICCIQSIAEAQIAIDNGAFAIGLVSKMPSGPGVISESKIREIAEWAPENIKTVLLTSLQNAEELIEQHNYCETDILQLVDSQETETYRILKKELSNVELMQVIHVIDDNSITDAVKISKYIDFILLDSGNPNLQTKELGGTGKTHNWQISKDIVDEVDLPVFLAGGLNPENVAEAIKRVKPFGVDVCSGVRTDGNLDTVKIKRFIKAIIE